MVSVLIVIGIVLCAFVAIETLLTLAEFVLAALLSRGRETEPLDDARKPSRVFRTMVLEVLASVRTHITQLFSLIRRVRPTSMHLRLAHNPVLLVHGYSCNGSCWNKVRRRLKKNGVAQVFAIDLKPKLGDISDFAQQLSDRIDTVLETTGAAKLDIVAHSMGGIVSRYYLTVLGGEDKVGTLITLGSPHHGSRLARFAPGVNTRQMRPGSEFLDDLNVYEKRSRKTCVVSVWSSLDEMLVPRTTAILGGDVKNVRVDYHGHMMLLYSAQVFRIIWDELSS